MQQYLEILGHSVKDIVTGIQGVATTVGFDLYGCVQVIVTPLPDKDGKPKDQHWFDFKRLVVQSKKPVMTQPSFYNPPGGQVGKPVR